LGLCGPVGGELLIATAAMIGDQEDLHIWRARRNEWVEEASVVLETHFGPLAAEAVRATARVSEPHSGWQVALPKETDRLRAAVDVLREFVTDDFA
jgi:hypothetical protein